MAAEIIFREAAGKFCCVASDEPLLMFITGKKKIRHDQMHVFLNESMK